MIEHINANLFLNDYCFNTSLTKLINITNSVPLKRKKFKDSLIILVVFRCDWNFIKIFINNTFNNVYNYKPHIFNLNDISTNIIFMYPI